MRVKSLFPEKIKVHTMATRDEEHYQVKHANTGRLMKSAVPFMQRLLNLEENNQQKRQAINEHKDEKKTWLAFHVFEHWFCHTRPILEFQPS